MQLAKAVQQKIQYHDERHALWNGRREDIVTQIKADGIEVNEKSVLQYASPKMRDYQQGGDTMITATIFAKSLPKPTRNWPTTSGARTLMMLGGRSSQRTLAFHSISTSTTGSSFSAAIQERGRNEPDHSP